MSIFNYSDKNGKYVYIEVLSRDRIGLVGEICSVISECGADIREHHAKVFSDGKGGKRSLFKVTVIPSGSSDTLLHRLDKLKGVISVTAYDS